MSAKTPSLLARFALDRPELRAWAMYDWANSAMATVVVTAVFPIFFRRVPGAGLSADEQRAYFGWTTTACLLAVAVISPLLGALADFRRAKKKMLGMFLALGALATGAMTVLGEGDWKLALLLFALANVGAAGSFVFYDALLPHVAREGETDRLSSAGYALGYLGGGLCLALCVALILRPGAFGLPAGDALSSSDRSLPTRVGFAIVAVWWVVFSVPLFRRVPEPPLSIEPDESTHDHPLRAALSRLGETFTALRAFRHAFLLMLAFLIYNDGIGTIIRMAAVFGEERRIDPHVMLGCILMVQFVGIPFTLLFGRLASSIGAKRSILIALAGYAGICLYAYGMDSEREFVVMAFAVGMVQGGAQALSRSLFASLVPKHKSAEFFGLFSTLEKFAGVLGPALFSVSPSSGFAIVSLIGFFVVGAALLAFVDVGAGRRAAALAEADVRSAAS